MNEWEIVDDNGVIYSGSDSEMMERFHIMITQREDNDTELEDEDDDWEGDLKLIEVHGRYR